MSGEPTCGLCRTAMVPTGTINGKSMGYHCPNPQCPTPPKGKG